MRVRQIATSLGENCGIAFFAKNLHARLRAAGVAIETVSRLKPESGADLVLLQHHGELIPSRDVAAFCRRSDVPVVLFAHDTDVPALHHVVAGFVTMCPGMIATTERPVLTFPHPAWTPAKLHCRRMLRRRYGLPQEAVIVGTNGFLKFERQFVEVVSALLPRAHEDNWFIELIASPWRLESPGLAAELARIQQDWPDRFRFTCAVIATPTLNRRLQACDLLWCWTGALSSSYASGVISDQYASGTRIFAADKLQHEHVLSLPNTIRGPDRLVPFIDALATEIGARNHSRHSPTLVSWESCIGRLVEFLTNVVRVPGATQLRSRASS